MTRLLPELRLPWRRRRPTPGPVWLRDVLRARVRHIAAPGWQHRPPEPFERAEVCGQCGRKIPPASVDGEFCSALCASAWLRDSQTPVHTCQPPPMIGPRPVDEPPAVEPPWMARLTAWERKKAELLMEPRKSPEGEVAA